MFYCGRLTIYIYIICFYFFFFCQILPPCFFTVCSAHKVPRKLLESVSHSSVSCSSSRKNRLTTVSSTFKPSSCWPLTSCFGRHKHHLSDKTCPQQMSKKAAPDAQALSFHLSLYSASHGSLIFSDVSDMGFLPLTCVQMHQAQTTRYSTWPLSENIHALVKMRKYLQVAFYSGSSQIKLSLNSKKDLFNECVNRGMFYGLGFFNNNKKKSCFLFSLHCTQLLFWCSTKLWAIFKVYPWTCFHSSNFWLKSCVREVSWHVQSNQSSNRRAFWTTKYSIWSVIKLNHGQNGRSHQSSEVRSGVVAQIDGYY